MSGASAVQKQTLVDVLQNTCLTCNFIKKRLQHRCFPMKSTLVAASGSKQCTLKVHATEKEMMYLNGTSKVSVSR